MQNSLERAGSMRLADVLATANFLMLLCMVVLYAAATKPSDVLAKVEAKATILEQQIARNAESARASAEANASLVAAQRDLLKEFSKIQSSLFMLIQSNMRESRQLRDELEAVAKKNGLELPEQFK